MEQVRQINCCNIECDNWEEFPADTPRSSAQNFEYMSPLPDNGAVYKCPYCNSNCESTIENKE